MLDLKESSRIFFDGSVQISEASWNSVVRSLITFADKVWLRSDTRILMPDRNRTMLSNRVLRELESEGIIETWALEGIEPQLSQARRVISTTEQIEISRRLSEEFARYAESIQLRPDGEVERTSRIIDFRHGMWKLGIASLCEASGILTEKATIQQGDVARLYSTLDRSFVEPLFRVFGFEGLWRLSTADILDLRKNVSAFRERLSILTKNIEFLAMSDVEKLERYAKLQEEYNAEIGALLTDRTSLARTSRSALEDGVYGVISLVLPFVSAVPIVKRFVSWLSDHKRIGFVVFMHMIDCRLSQYSNEANLPRGGR